MCRCVLTATAPPLPNAQRVTASNHHMFTCSPVSHTGRNAPESSISTQHDFRAESSGPCSQFGDVIGESTLRFNHPSLDTESTECCRVP